MEKMNLYVLKFHEGNQGGGVLKGAFHCSSLSTDSQNGRIGKILFQCIPDFFRIGNFFCAENMNEGMMEGFLFFLHRLQGICKLGERGNAEGILFHRIASSLNFAGALSLGFQSCALPLEALNYSKSLL